MAGTIFQQDSYGVGTIRSKSIAFGSSFSVGSPRFNIETLFQGSYDLKIDVPHYIGNVSYRLVLPMHGRLASSKAYYTPGETYATASTNVTVDGAQAFSGSVSVDGFHNFNAPPVYTATGGWVGRISYIDGVLPGFPNDPGIELASLDSVSLGQSPSPLGVHIGYELRTSASIQYAASAYAISDFSGTGSFEIQAFDDLGNQLSGVEVVPAAVPEPATFTALAGGLVLAARRRRKTT